MSLKLDANSVPSGDISNIQKLVVLLNDNIYSVFMSHLQSINAHLPLRLIAIIRKNGFAFQTTDELCEMIYQKPVSESRNNFYQLSNHAFRLSEFIAINYPSYLLHNIGLVEELVAKQQMSEAQLLSKILLDVAVKIDDFTTQMHVLRFMENQEHLYKQPIRGKQYCDEYRAAQENNKVLSDIYSMLRNDFNMVVLATKKNPEEITSALEYLKSFHSYHCKSISLLSRYTSIYIRHYFQTDNLRIGEEIDDFQKDMNNNSFLLMPYLFDIKTSSSFVRLGIPGLDLNGKEGTAMINVFKKHYESIQYWKSYLNIPKVSILLLKGRGYIEKYSPVVHHRDYLSLIPASELADMGETAEECLKMIEINDSSKAYISDIMSLMMVYGALLILRGGSYILNGISHTESSIISFQQMKKSRTVGNSYFVLMMGYFIIADYKQCIATFARYQKVSKNRDMYEQIDIGVHIYYHFSLWLLEKNPESVEAIKNIYSNCDQHNIPPFMKTLLENMSSYFGLEEITVK